MPKERRKYQRYSIKIPAVIKGVDEKAIVRDISAGGLAVKTLADWEEEAQVSLNFKIDRNHVRFSG